jgi:RecB family exonuclease
MKTFLQYVADDLVSHFGSDLSRVAVVFPNKRASLFMNEYLAQLNDRPIWSPAYITISDLFRRHSERQVGDPIKLVCDLHRCFIEQTNIDETLDHFYGWGQLLVADFDDIDKHMVDADHVLSNLRDLHELDDLSYLTAEQREALSRFFSNFSVEQNTELKQRFLKLWSHMADIYHAFNQRLTEQGLAYEGALYREVAERLETEGWKDNDSQYDTYAFVGFNLIQPVEQRLFTFLKKQGRTRFYWDFDRYYMNSNNEAGHYIAQQLELFPNALDSTDADIYERFSRHRCITYISAPTENAQARYISTWLRNIGQTTPHAFNAWPNTAIVLCNEGLLQTVIHCLPDEVEQVNITTGYPLIQSPVASLVKLLLSLQSTGYSVQRDRFRLSAVNAVLRHPYAHYVSLEANNLLKQLSEQKNFYPTPAQLAVDEGTTLLFTPVATNQDLLKWLIDIIRHIADKRSPVTSASEEKPHPFPEPENGERLFDSQFSQESLFRMYTLLNRLLTLVDNGDLKVDSVTMQRLISQLIASASVPFHGEPAEGLQIMGVLETRNLDFDHVLLLSCNEGNMPRGINDTSFIPYSIRKAYGLTTADHKVAIYSYYFHRLLQRASDISILYNNATTDGQRGEMSRFMLQLMVESPHTIRFHTLQTAQSFVPFCPKPIDKTPEVMKRLSTVFSVNAQPSAQQSNLNGVKSPQPTPLLTPTAINRYMRCPLLFYYNYVCGLRQPDETEDDVIDSRIFGNIFHEASRIIYTRLMSQSRQIAANDIDQLLRSRVDIERAVDTAMEQERFHCSNLNGLQIINREVIIHYLRQLLQIDRRLAPFTIIGLECDTIVPLHTKFIDTTIGGRIDRLDCITEFNPATGVHEKRIRVVDYKTGSRVTKPLADVDAIFQQENLTNHNDYYLQTFLYSCIVSQSAQYNPSQQAVSPALLFIQHASAQDYDPVLFFGKTRIDDVRNDASRFGELLRQTIDEIFCPDTAFAPTTEQDRCTHCPYRQLCRQGQ